MSQDGVPTQVLVVDDYPDLAELLAELIRMASLKPVEVAVAFDGMQAVAMATSRQYGCVVMDLDMPVLDGVSAAIAIREHLGPKAPLLIAMTGNPAHEDSLRARGAFDHFLGKPVDIDALLELVASCVRLDD